jgi:nitrite transporter NirC
MLGNHPDTITLAGFAHNLVWVTVGNAIAGVLFMGAGYWYVANDERTAPREVLPAGRPVAAE